MQSTLNTKIWDGTALRPEVRAKLEAVATKFLAFLDVGAAPVDIIFTGSLASYGWAPQSDIDLHVVLDFGAIDGGGKLVKDLMMAKKGLWNEKHHVVIRGFPVEMYAQDAAEPHYAQGIYSIMNDKWVKEPAKDAGAVVDEATVDKKTIQLKHEIDEAIRAEDLDAMAAISVRLKDMRAAGLSSGGEYSVENQTFKRLRRDGYLGKLAEAKLEISDKLLSLNNKESTMTTKTATTLDTSKIDLTLLKKQRDYLSELLAAMGDKDDQTGEQLLTGLQNLLDAVSDSTEDGTPFDLSSIDLSLFSKQRNYLNKRISGMAVEGEDASGVEMLTGLQNLLDWVADSAEGVAIAAKGTKKLAETQRPISIGYLNILIADNNAQYGTEFYIGGSYGNYDLWAKVRGGGEERIESGSRKDIYNAFVKYRFNDKYRTKEITMDTSAAKKTSALTDEMKAFLKEEADKDTDTINVSAKFREKFGVDEREASRLITEWQYGDPDYFGKSGSRKTADYQGWQNYETWAIALWLDNEEANYVMVRDWVTELRGAEPEQVKEGIWTAEEALKFNLADRIQEFFEDNNPLADEATVYSDLMHAALSEVDWHEVAEHYIDKDEEAQSFKDPLFGEGKEPARDLPAADDIQLKGGSLMAAIDSMGKVAGTYEDEFVAALRKKFPAAGDTVVSDAYDLVDLQDAQHEGLSPQAVVGSLGQDASGKIVWAAKTAAPKKKTKKPTPKVKTPEAAAAPAPEAAPAPVESTPVSFDKDTVQAEMAKELEAEADDLTVEDSHMSSFGVAVYNVKDGQREYSVVASEDEAETLAKAVVRQDLEDEPGMFEPNFITQHLTMSDTDRRIISSEEADNRYDDMDDRDVEKEYTDIVGDAPKTEEGSDEPDYESMREELKERATAETYEELSDPVQYFVKDHGIYTLDELRKAPFIRIDIDAATDEAVSVDGWPHFVSREDESYETTPAGFVYWREN